MVFSNIDSLSFLNIAQKQNTNIVDLLKAMPEFHIKEPINFSLELLEWLISIGYPLLIGTVLVAVSLSFMGYVVANFAYALFKKN